MTGLFDLLDRAATDGVEVDVAADLRRGHRALRRRRARIAAGATGGVAVLGVVGASVLPLHRDEVVARSATQPGTELLHTEFYDVPAAPPGWHLVGGTAWSVLYRQDGDTSTDLDGPYEQAILVYLEADRVHEGPPITFHGRTFYEWGDGGGGMESMAVEMPDGDTLRLQYPKSAGFDSTDMIAFLDAVVVKDGAKATVG